MKIESESDVERLVRSDQWMMKVLTAAEELNLPDWWIGAGFLRDRIWDAIAGKRSTVSRDVDLVYFDSGNTAAEADWEYDNYMMQRHPFAEWEVRNQARMHYKNGFDPYGSTAEGISNWVETATCVGVRVKSGKLEFLWCHGMEDVIGLVARPTERFRAPELFLIFQKRVAEKHWKERWPHLVVKES